MFKRAIGLVAVVCVCASALAGDLDPPAGPVDSTFKTLNEVEPSRPIESLPGNATARHVISEPGAYHLTGNLLGFGASGPVFIEVETSGVTIDLRGFLMSVNNTADHAILDVSSGSTGLTVRNGRIQSTLDEAIFAPNARQALIEYISFENADLFGGAAVVVGDGSIVRDVRLVSGGGVVVGNSSIVQRVINASGRETIFAGNGCVISDVVIRGSGSGGSNRLISVGNGCLIERVTARNARNRGILAGAYATVRDCSFTNDSGTGVNTAVQCGDHARVENVTIEFWGSSGIFVGEESIVRDCIVQGPVSGGNTGILTGVSSLIEGCSVREHITGIFVQESLVLNCSVNGATGVGIASGAESLVEGCRLNGNGTGISGDFATVIRDNVLRENTVGIDVVNDTRVENNQLDGDGIVVGGQDNVIDGNVITDQLTDAIVVGVSGNVITRNRVGGGTGAYNIAAGNQVGTIRTMPVGAGPWDNFAF